MAYLRKVFSLTGTSPAAASTAAFGNIVYGLERYNWFTVHANLQGATGGTLDVVLQRKITDDVWSDWIAFTQLADSAAAISYACDAGPSSTIAVVGGGTDSTPTVVLAADSVLGGHPGTAVRMVGVAGSGTSAGAAQTVYLVCQLVGTF